MVGVVVVILLVVSGAKPESFQDGVVLLAADGQAGDHLVQLEVAVLVAVEGMEGLAVQHLLVLLVGGHLLRRLLRVPGVLRHHAPSCVREAQPVRGEEREEDARLRPLENAIPVLVMALECIHDDGEQLPVQLPHGLRLVHQGVIAVRLDELEILLQEDCSSPVTSTGADAADAADAGDAGDAGDA
eukprot:CAMPEP_0181460248 /NCGR_PEP_ID=MMETSP1110-20121109/33242_1 /TAXON_ID=174948 /ORGANISM="Symbiodinium sp., Strain CCMP421" /LENGTH=185 /DNA_ID=CAMNT_0023584791 /DNA_START=63 /DNA_END=621 /DNA_ORIENTATION=+